jgi:TRAP-type C4-dicarboxylate transport system permease small subunit
MFERVRSVFKKICIIALIPVSIAILVQMFYVFINVGGRYLFNQPVPGAMEVSGESMIYIVYLSLAYIQTFDGHIRIDLLFPYMGRKAKGVQDIISYLLGIVFFGFILWFSFKAALNSFKITEVMWGSVALPVYTQRLAVSLGSFMMIIQLILDLIQTLFHLNAPTETEASTLKVEVI